MWILSYLLINIKYVNFNSKIIIDSSNWYWKEKIDKWPKKNHTWCTYVFSETGFRNMFYQYKKSSKTERQKNENCWNRTWIIMEFIDMAVWVAVSLRCTNF